jgi:membrane protease YdiL (CAAX protease family)
MSLALATDNSQQLINLPTIFAAAAALVVAVIAGAPRRIRGPKRLSDKETVGDIMSIAGVGLMGWAAATALMPRFIPDPTKVTDGQLLFASTLPPLCAFLAMLPATLIIRVDGVQKLGLSLNRIPQAIWQGVLAILIVFPLMLVASAINEWAWTHLQMLPHPEAHEMLQMIQRNHVNRLLQLGIVISAVVVAPLAEEMFFRGGIQTILRYATNLPWIAVLITSLFFALMHEGWTRGPIFFLGICLGYIYERTGNLWTCIILHSLFNCSAIFLFWKFH